MRKVRGGRALLNLPGHHSTAAIIAEIEDTKDWQEGKDRNGRPVQGYTAQPEWTFTISDCSGSVNLELDFGTDNNLENNLHKIDTIINTLKEFRRGVIVEHARHKKRVAHVNPDQRFGQFSPDE